MAENQDENVELIDDEAITLYDDEGNAVEFNEVAVVEYDGNFYALLQPVTPLEGMNDDEALIFKVEQDGDEDKFEPVMDEAVLEAVFNEYLKAEAEFGDGCDCDCDDCRHDGCDCDDCDHDCDHND